jgi:hypothetical protein
MPQDGGAQHSAELLIQTLVDLKPADLADALLELPDTRMIEVVASCRTTGSRTRSRR